MTVYAGSEGFVDIGGNTIAEVKDFSISESASTTSRTVLGDAYERKQATTKSWSGSLNAFFDDTDTTGQDLLIVGAEVTLNLYSIGDTTGRAYFTGSAIITEFSSSTNNEGLVEATFSFEGNGALTRGTAA